MFHQTKRFLKEVSMYTSCLEGGSSERDHENMQKSENS